MAITKTLIFRNKYNYNVNKVIHLLNVEYVRTTRSDMIVSHSNTVLVVKSCITKR